MEKVTFKVEVTKVKKLPKNATPEQMEAARQSGKYSVKIEGTFNADQTDALALLLKTWSNKK